MLTINVTENLVLKSVLSNLKASVKEDTVDARSSYKTSTDSRRCRLLAYTFLKGRTYKQVESNPRYLRAGYYGYDSSLKYEQERIIKAIAAHIPEDLGDGVSREAILQQIKFWLEMGTATRYQIIDNLEGMLAVQGLLQEGRQIDLGHLPLRLRVHDGAPVQQQRKRQAVVVAAPGGVELAVVGAL